MEVSNIFPNLSDFLSNFTTLVQSNVVSESLIKSVEAIAEFCFQLLTDNKPTCRENFEYQQEKIQVVLDYAWEKLNTGYWKDVNLSWRYLYSFASALKSLLLYNAGKFSDAVKACDMGVLMGAPISNGLLQKLAACYGHLAENGAGKLHYEEAKTDDAILNNEYGLTRLDCPSLMDFQKLLCGKIPVIITNSIAHWPAMTKWSLDYLVAVAGERTVPVEIGRRYTDNSWSQKLMTIKQFISDYILQNETMGYLAQHELFNQIPELRNDIAIPDYCCVRTLEGSYDDEESIDVNAWFGPRGTISPLHYDPKNNLLAQVIGQKYVRLYEEKYSESVYPYPSKTLSNTSQIDVENPDEEKFPDFKRIPYFECILNPGDLLFIPAKCWHYVRSLSLSFSVSFWWD